MGRQATILLLGPAHVWQTTEKFRLTIAYVPKSVSPSGIV